MDPTGLTQLLDFGSNGLILAIVLGAFRFIESQKAKRNGGTVYDRISTLSERVAVIESFVAETTSEIERLSDYTRAFHRDFMIPREDVRLQQARLQGARDALKEKELKQ